MATLLIISAGHSDLQFVAELAGRPMRVWGESRQVHQWLLDHSDQLCMVDDPGFLRAVAGEERVGEAALFAALDAATQKDEPIAVVPAKLSAIAHALRQTPPAFVLVLNTRRDAQRFPREPIAAGLVLSRWFGKLFDLDCETAASTCVSLDYLQGTEDLNRPADFDVAVHRIAEAIAGMKRRGASDALIADTGGLGVFKEAVQLLAGMYFDGKVRHRTNPDNRMQKRPQGPLTEAFDLVSPKSIPTDLEPASSVPPEESSAQLAESPIGRMRVRSQVSSLLRKCDPVSANALMELYATGQRRPKWAEAVASASEVLSGQRLDPLGASEAWLLPDRASIPRVLLPALRVECALHSGRLAEAAAYTCDFFDWCYFEGVRTWIRNAFSSQLGCEADVVEVNVNRQVTWPTQTSQTLDVPALMHACGFIREDEAKTSGRFVNFGLSAESTDLGHFRTRAFDWNGSDLSRVNLKPLAGNSAWLAVLGMHGLTDYRRRLDSPVNGTQRRPTYIRNAHIHNGLAGAATNTFSYAISDVVDVYVKAGLWEDVRWTDSSARASVLPGSAFLQREPVERVLSDLGFTELAKTLGQNYREWFESLRALVHLGD